MDKGSWKDGINIDKDKSSILPAENPNEPKPSATFHTLDLSKKRLSYLNEDLYKNNNCVKNLHLEANTLGFLPDSLFLYLPNLVWLDLRYNEITSLPTTIGKHRLLKYLLLEGNPIKALPVQLGDLSTLKALNLRHCPLEFPPEDVVCKGLESILSFLRKSKHAQRVYFEQWEPDLPTIEKLDLNGLMKSSLDLTDEEERKFEMLKRKMEEREREEMVNETLYFQNERQKISDPGKSKAAVTGCRKTEADKHTEKKELLAIALQKQKKQDVLKEWQKQTKLMQEQKATNRKKKENQQKVPIAVPPYATEMDPFQNKNNWDKQKPLGVEAQEMMPRIMSVKSLKEMEKERASRNVRLQHRIQQHIQTMQERKRNPKHSAQEEMEAARKELEMATFLQAELLQRKRDQDLPLEYRFTAFTGDLSPCASPRGRSQNIFTMT